MSAPRRFLRRGVPLHDAVAARIRSLPVGRVLDAGTGKGLLARALAVAGYQVHAIDCFPERFAPTDSGVFFLEGDLNRSLPYADESFDYIACTEVIEHVENPQALLREFHRVLRKDGRLYLSTPNILNLSSRLRFLLEGGYDFFKYPLPEWAATGTADLHLHPIRYHELEYYLATAQLAVEEVFTSLCHYNKRLFLFPVEFVSRLQMVIKNWRSARPEEISTARLYRILGSTTLLYGEHLIVAARKVLARPGLFNPDRALAGLVAR